MPHLIRTLRRPALLLVAVVALVASLSGTASAETIEQLDARMRGAGAVIPGGGGERQRGSLPSTPSTPATPVNPNAPKPSAPTPVAPPVEQPPVTRPSTRRSSRRPARRCRTVKRRSHGRIRRKKVCRRVPRSVGKARSRASTLNWQGWSSSPSPTVGRLYTVGADGRKMTCSGTMVTATLMLTAGHCVHGGSGYHRQLTFVPGQGTTAAGMKTAPYGVWEASRWWTPDGYRQGDMALDYALVEIPAQAGRRLGDLVGSWSITPGLQWNTGARVSLAGYPASGFWATAQGYYGNGQYVCNGTWDEGYGRVGTGYELWTSCGMNGGASGGPWFVQLSDGRWTIGGVNSQCYSNANMRPESYCQPHSDYLRTPYLDNRFLEFWNSVAGQAR